MSESPDDERLEKLREERVEQLKEQQEQQQASEEAESRQDAAEAQKQALLRQYLTDGARQRLNSVRMSKPEFAEQVESQIISLARSGRIQGKIDEEKMKALLSELSPESKRFDITRR